MLISSLKYCVNSKLIPFLVIFRSFRGSVAIVGGPGISCQGDVGTNGQKRTLLVMHACHLHIHILCLIVKC